MCAYLWVFSKIPSLNFLTMASQLLLLFSLHLVSLVVVGWVQWLQWFAHNITCKTSLRSNSLYDLPEITSVTYICGESTINCQLCVCACVCVRMHTYICVRMHTYICVRMHTFVCVCTSICVLSVMEPCVAWWFRCSRRRS